MYLQSYSDMALGLISFFGLNIASLLSAYFLMNLFLTKKFVSFSFYLFGIFIFYHSLIVVTEIILGTLGFLSHFSASLVTYLLLAVIFFFARSISRPTFEITKFQLKILNSAVVIFSLPVVILFIRLCNALIQVPLEFDAQVYHLPIATEWFQTNNLIEVYYSAFAGPLGYYPSTYELLYLWYILPFKSDLILNILNFPLFTLIIVALYAILRELKVRPLHALIGASAPLYLPVFTHQLGTIFVDTFFTLNILLAVFFLIQLLQKRHIILSSALLGLSIGLFMGTKYLGLAYSLPILFASFVVYMLNIKDKIYMKGSVMALISWFVLGSFFYIRNWLNSGNPIFPVEISISNLVLFKGYKGTDEVLQGTSIMSHVFEPSAWMQLFNAFTTMWGYTGWFILSCTPVVAVLALMQIKKSKESRIVFLLVIGVIIYLILYSLAPYSWRNLIHNVRFAMPALALGSIVLGYLFNNISRSQKIILIIVTLIIYAHDLVELLTRPAYKMILDVESFASLLPFNILVLFTLAVPVGLLFFKQKAIRFAFGVCSTILVSITLLVSNGLREQWSQYFISIWYPPDNPYSVVFEAGKWLDENDMKANVAYAGFHFQYPLVGRSLDRQVDYVNINDCQDCRYEDFRNSPNSIRSNPDYDSWLYNLKKKGERYLVIHKTLTPGLRMYELEWTELHRESFDLVFEKADLLIYRII